MQIIFSKKFYKCYCLFFFNMDILEKQVCPLCGKSTLTLIEKKEDIPYFGKVYLFSMQCSSCDYNKSDVEAEETKDPCSITFTIEKESDMKIRVVKSSEATVKIPQMRMSVTPGPASEGYVSNIEGVLNRFQKILEDQRELSEEIEERKYAKNLLKKLWKVKNGDLPLKVIIEDSSGNSAIISEKVVVSKLKVK